ncbi:NAD(P)-binding protein [Rickenella mellea]|uniref:D-xylose 1-dehydrogenase (NADP(+), D-xylono-1,5-lactone-forming) n=1 Tax=Rickenella mellea TaxID=50990 RepID=A0A4R5XHE0_9AGAM|nr:NAD(P)-binding protein [Rickenella mellea]
MSSTTEKPYVLRWGIVGCGGISSSFAKDLVLAPSTRNVSDVAHAIAACGSRSLEKAEEFIKGNCPEGGCAQVAGYVKSKPVAKGNYEDVFKHEDVDIIYIGTPHTSHYVDCKAALESGKHVLLEKPATLNQAEFIALGEMAKSKKLFLMEAVWTRFFPLVQELQDVLFKEQAIGEIRRVNSDFSLAFLNNVPKTHRLLNPELAGGGLLDLGPYPLVWAMLTLFQNPKNERSPPTNITASMIKDESGIDLFTNWTLDFPKLGARAALSVTVTVNSPKDCVTRIQGTKGEVVLPWPTARPDTFTIRRSQEGLRPQPYVEDIRTFPIVGTGLHWEADAVARSIRDGRLENEKMPISETILTMGIFDKVRRLGGYVFPDGLEKVTTKK